MDGMSSDRETLGRLAKALAFIAGADHPATRALGAAAASGSAADIKKARSLFVKLKVSERQAALAMIAE